MVQAIINLGDWEDRVLTIVKGKYGFKNKSEAVNFVIETFEEDHLEPSIRPEYVEKIRKIEKEGNFEAPSERLRKAVKNAGLLRRQKTKKATR